ncbi:MAG: ISNCY family transposase [Anaerolineales bacterium]|jgi:transposase
MKKDMLTMSKKELTRLEVIQKLTEKRLKQREAAEILCLSTRQIRRLLRNYNQEGAAGLISKQRGRPSNNQLDAQLKRKTIELLHNQYADFGPTLACEKLEERDGVKLSRESVRQIMMAEELWKPHRRKRARIHQLRTRRACVGELVQIDGSPHDWFEGRSPNCNVIAFVDDASGRLMELLFTPEETTFGYFAAARQYLSRCGLPKAFYSDKNGIFRVNIKNALSGSGMSQFGRAMRQLDIEIICANTPQAKGRIERAFQTLQDRLVKELRLNLISDIDSANQFAPIFIDDYNHRFAVQPRSNHDAHRPLLFSPRQLDLIFSHQVSRTISKNLTLQYKNVVYQIQTSRPGYALRKAQVTVCEAPQGNISILYKGKPLAYSVFRKQQRQAEVVQSKHINTHLDNKSHSPAADHPWRNYGHRLNGKPISKKQDSPS